MVDLIDVVLQSFKDAVNWFTGLFMQGLKQGYHTLSVETFGTPTPQTDGAFVFGQPTNAPWQSIHHALIGGEIMVVSLLLLVVCVQGRHLIRIFNIGSAYESRRTRKTAWVGSFLIITWYWIAVLTLYLVNGFTIALLPSLSSVSAAMIDLLRFSLHNAALSLVFGMLGGLSMWALEALYYIRGVLLYVYIYGMPIAFALAYGNIPVLSDVAMGFSKRFVPLAILPLPAAVVFKGYDLLYAQNALNPSSPFLSYIVAVSLPLVALVVTWKTFEYATPLTAKAIGTATQGAALVGGVAAGVYVGGASVATTAARWGPKAAAGQAVAEHASRRAGDEESGETPSYRRTENDPNTR
ncbi:hypothetical protein GCM10009037_27950 [Halarchaeum grantii]|uniref:Type IV secretion system protein TrbL n=1 Tax=Halarchaeum grantii TaxID=1193105 RepID=A0A830EXX1_9EURY|nr:hypothetical protein [Halarchaeum grantii]GGL42811.1 hypothetical protein GCM10009037_27950 [Halarchaeum grantii]